MALSLPPHCSSLPIPPRAWGCACPGSGGAECVESCGAAGPCSSSGPLSGQAVRERGQPTGPAATAPPSSLRRPSWRRHGPCSLAMGLSCCRAALVFVGVKTRRGMAREEASPVPRIHGVYPEWVKGQGQGPGAWVHRGLGLTGAKRESHGSETQAVRAGAPNARARAHAAHAKRPVDGGGHGWTRQAAERGSKARDTGVGAGAAGAQTGRRRHMRPQTKGARGQTSHAGRLPTSRPPGLVLGVRFT